MPHSLLSTIRDLKRRRGRERRGLTLIEGVRLVEEAIAAGVRLRGVVTAPSLETTPRGAALKTALLGHGVAITAVKDRELEELADTDQPQGVVAVIEPRAWTLEDITVTGRAVVLVLDGVQDPGNVGTLARTAFGLGAAGLVGLRGTAELTNPKVLRAGMGALFRLPSTAVSDDEFLRWIRRAPVSLWVADAAGTPVDQAALAWPLALVVGNEGAGVRRELRTAARQAVAVPLRPHAESLNVAAAAAILLYEVTRER